jgi:hypothetical protein
VATEHEPQDADRAQYGKEIVRELATRLTNELGSGFSKTRLEYMRRFPSCLFGANFTDCPDALWAIGDDRHVRTEAENHTIGIVLCKKNNSVLVEIALPKDANIHAREYQLYLPSKEEMQQKLVEWMGEQDGQAELRP